MSNQKLVRCAIGRPGSADESVRYVPLEILGLWEHVMRVNHGFECRGTSASVWVELDEATGTSSPKSTVERVTELSLYYFDVRLGMLSHVCRFVPEPDVGLVKSILLRHYGTMGTSRGQTPWMRERQGVWFRPREDAPPRHTTVPEPSVGPAGN
jgi:hypothetical protein